MRWTKALALGAGLVLSGCQTMKSQLPPVHTIDVNAVSAVQAEIKRQVGIYQRASAADRARRLAAKPDKVDYWCGANGLDFEISSVKVDLLTSTDSTAKQNLGFKIPVSAFTLGPTGTHSYEATNVQELIYNEWLVSRPGGAPDETLVGPQSRAPSDRATLADILLALRNGLIEASRKSRPPLAPNGPQACFTAYNQAPDKAKDDPGDTIKIAFTAVGDATAGVSLDLGVASLGGSYEGKNTGSSTLTVSFRELGSVGFQACKDDKTKVCGPDGRRLTSDDHFVYRLPDGIPTPGAGDDAGSPKTSPKPHTPG